MDEKLRLYDLIVPIRAPFCRNQEVVHARIDNMYLTSGRPISELLAKCEDGRIVHARFFPANTVLVVKETSLKNPEKNFPGVKNNE